MLGRWITRPGLSRAAAALRRDTSGTTALEFALIAAPFIALLCAVLQTSLIYFVQESLETSAEAAARNVITGQAQAADAAASGMTQAQLQARFKNAACASLPSFLSCSQMLVDVRSATSWGALDTSVPTITFDAQGNITNSSSYSLGTQGSVIMVRLMYVWPVQAAPIELGLANLGNGKRLVIATSVAKTETYSS